MKAKIKKLFGLAIFLGFALLLLQFIPVDNLTKSSELTDVSGNFVEAVKAFEEEDYRRAADLLEGFSGKPPLSAYSSYLLARAELELGDKRKALEIVDTLRQGEGVLGYERLLLEAKILLKLERIGRASEAAASAAEFALTKDEERRARELQLSIAVAAENYDAALKRGIELVEVTDLRFVGERRDQLLNKLGGIIDNVDLKEDENLEYLYRYIDLLTDYGEYRRARGLLLRNMGKWTGSLKYKAYFELAWLDGFKLEHPEEARWTFQRLLGMKQPRWFEAKSHYYHTLFKAGDAEDYDLIENLLKVGRNYPGTYFGKLAVNRAFSEKTEGANLNKLDHELGRFKNAMSRSAVRSTTWRLFYRSFAEGKFSIARDYLISLESFYDELPPKFVFWRYRTTSSANGSANYLQLVGKQEEEPINYYSLLAGEKGWTRGSFSLSDTWGDREIDLGQFEAEIAERSWPGSTGEKLVYSVILKNHGLYGPALRRLKRLRGELPEEDYLFLKSQWERLAGEYRASLKSATELLSWYYAHNQAPPVTVVRSAFPTYYGQQVGRAAGRFGVPRALVFAIIRQESTFAPDAYGRAGEHGLMQIMPGTARGIAADLEMENFQPEDTFDPAINIKMGSYYISKQMSRQNGQVRLALAAYNGGPGNVRRWKESFGSEDVDIFVERIPIGYTQDYVKSVYRNYLVYRALLSE